MGEERLCARLLAGIQTLFLITPNSVTFDKSPHLSESLSSSAHLFSSFASDSLCFSCKKVRLQTQRRNKFDAEFLPLTWPWGPRSPASSIVNLMHPSSSQSYFMHFFSHLLSYQKIFKSKPQTSQYYIHISEFSIWTRTIFQI